MKGNIFTGIPDYLPDELVDVLAGNPGIRIERIVSRGHESPKGFWYDQNQDEFVLLVRGAAELTFENEDKSVRLETGDYLVIPAHKRHRVEWTAPDRDTIWLTVFYKGIEKSPVNRNI